MEVLGPGPAEGGEEMGRPSEGDQQVRLGVPLSSQDHEEPTPPAHGKSPQEWTQELLQGGRLSLGGTFDMLNIPCYLLS